MDASALKKTTGQNAIAIADLAIALGAECHGDVSLLISSAVHPDDGGRANSIAMAMSPELVDLLKASKAKAAVVNEGMDWQSLGLEAAIVVKHSRAAMSIVTETFARPWGLETGIHPTAVISSSATLGKGAAIGPFVIVEDNVTIGSNAIIMGHCSIGANAVIGNNPLLHNGVRIGRDVAIGERVIIHQNAVVGADGFSYAKSELSAVETARASVNTETTTSDSPYSKIHSLGAVRLGHDVEIGANSTLDRGTLKDTSIGNGTKIDNLVQIGHNVEIGSDCLLCSQVGIAGSTTIGNHVVLGGKAGVADHIKIGDNVLIAGASGVAADVESNCIMGGAPAQKRDDAMKLQLSLRRLPRLINTVEKMKKQLSADKSKK